MHIPRNSSTIRITRALLGCAAVGAGLLGGWAAPAAPAPDEQRPGFPEAAFRADVERLASDEFGGRAPGTEGERKTLDYIEHAFREAGLAPGVGDSFLQPVPLVEIRTHADPTMTVRGHSGSVDLRFGDDMVVWTKRPVPESRVTGAELVFAGYGIVAPEFGWDDYAGTDVKGKIVMVLVNDPGFATGDPALFTGKAMTYYGRWTYKFEEAVRQGAAGLFVVHETEPAAYPWAVVRNGAGQEFDLIVEDYASKRLALEGWMTHESAEKVLALAGQDYAALKRAAMQRGFKARPLGITGSVGVRNDVERKVSYNVVGVVPGRERPGEYFLYTAHWDHLGTKAASDVAPGADRIFNGASDNATGVAGLLGLARAFAATRPRPARSTMFVAVTAEESGLLGSQYFAEHPPVPLASMVGGLNMDNLYAIGPTKDLTVIGFGASQLDDYLRRAAAKQGRVLVPEPTPEKGFYYRSDHFNLAKQGVPMLYTKAGIDSPAKGPDYGRKWLDDYVANRYHKPSDEYDPSWDVSGILQDLEIYYDVGLELANDSSWPNWREGSEFRAIRDASRKAAH
jgi:Zn-dependent M28 family amino/carboxypeptidase